MKVTVEKNPKNADQLLFKTIRDIAWGSRLSIDNRGAELIIGKHIRFVPTDVYSCEGKVRMSTVEGCSLKESDEKFFEQILKQTDAKIIEVETKELIFTFTRDYNVNVEVQA